VAKGVLIALTNPVSPNREDEFNKWYNTVHGPELLSIRGFTSLTRYKAKAQAIPPSPVPSYRYVAVYELNDVDEALSNLAAKAPTLKLSDSVDLPNILGIAFEKI
jgi:hypothetical protein